MLKRIPFGNTGLTVTKTSMGCLPVQRCDKEYGAKLIRAAYDGGIRFFDTANAYTDSEEKIGLALADVREQIVISTKSAARDKAGVLAHIENSLRMMKTDYIDIYQFHNPKVCPLPNDGSGLYEAMEEAKRQGMIRHIGITTHRIDIAEEIIRCGYYETLQYPFSYLSSDREQALPEKCKQAGMGMIAMKGLKGLITTAGMCLWEKSYLENILPYNMVLHH